MHKGRPTKSEIRQNMVALLEKMGAGYGYEIYKTYVKIFPKVSMRVIYYHLKKGVALDEFKVSKVEKEKGNYSWGETAEKVYYALGPKAEPKPNERVQQYYAEKTS